ncbi:MAG: glutamine--fructose-6-phosphate transaminase (isomerizing) [Candidatus Altiarchaeales archaeon]|nr:glutamine--fructose-6-phosphate transaminase (isomerizing) [Candidatus Altiarchaeales archaeon]
MCGITGYIGGQSAPTLLFDMLERLEYRGYDSAGIAYLAGGEIRLPKDKGKVSQVRAKLKPEKRQSHIGVGHTRWATHGVPNQVNAHPHADCRGEFAVAHNGIIENYENLKTQLIEDGHVFKSDTDTEVIAHLIEENYEGDFPSAFRKTLTRLEGSYAICAVSTKHPDKILVARKESPLLIGLGIDENFIASDAPAFLRETRKAIFLGDHQFGEVKKDSVKLYNLGDGSPLKPRVEEIEWELEDAQKGGYHHFMLKEIHEEPAAIKNALRSEPALSEIAGKLSSRKRLIFVGCGTAYHAGLLAKYLLESKGVYAEAQVASEFRYSGINTLDSDCAIIAVSQSGETADTIAALKQAKKKGAYTASIVNVSGSTITRLTEDVAYTYSGPEIAVASTKAYIGQVTALSVLSFLVCRQKKKLSDERFKLLFEQLKRLDDKLRQVLEGDGIKALAEEQAGIKKFFYIGRNLNYPTALEGALKLKEITYLHAEGYPAGELKHGPIAVLDSDTTVIALLQNTYLNDKMNSNIQEARARDANVKSVGVGGAIPVPEVEDELTPLVNIVPLHLFAYYLSVLKGLDPDKPRNLAKSVTVE